MSAPNTSNSATPPLARLSPACFGTVVYWTLVALTCAWVLSLPVWPSQDGPLHLYYVNIMKQLLAHQPGPYADTYYLKARITPYSAYYYGLLLLNRFVNLEIADKIIVCLCIVLFAGSTRTLLRVVSGRATWASFLSLPLLLNWPLAMGFLNYSLSVSLCILALATWCTGIGRPSLWSRVLFLLLIALMMVTHPVPWLIAVSFAMFELTVRLIGSLSQRYARDSATAMSTFRLDAATALLACLPYLYLHRFSHAVQTLEPPIPIDDPHLAHLLPSALLPYADRALHFLRSLGVDVFAGDTLLPNLYRTGTALLLLTAFAVACYTAVRQRKQQTWPLQSTWLLFTLCLLPFPLFLPDPLQDRYAFAERLGIFLFVAAFAAAAEALRGRIGLTLAAASCLLWLFTMYLAVRYITPAASAIASLRQAPAPPPSTLPGLAMRPSGGTLTAPGLNFQPDNWATAHYFRRNNRTLYNTAWLGDPIILVSVRPQALPHLDTTYYENMPWFGSVLLPDNDEAAAILHKVGFVLMMRQGASQEEDPFSADPEETEAAQYARGWVCQHGARQAWYFCLPPARE